VLQGVVGGVVRAEFRIEIAQNSDADRVAHALIVLEPLQSTSAASAYCGVSTVVHLSVTGRGDEKTLGVTRSANE
jgi:hypothetical protein